MNPPAVKVNAEDGPGSRPNTVSCEDPLAGGRAAMASGAPSRPCTRTSRPTSRSAVSTRRSPNRYRPRSTSSPGARSSCQVEVSVEVATGMRTTRPRGVSVLIAT